MAASSHRVLVLHGPNLDRLGLREPSVYGTMTLEALNARIEAYGAARGLAVETFQSNSEGALIEAIHRAADFDGLVVNPAGYTHTSVALHDALRSVPTPSIEVHLSNLFARESFRHTSVTAAACRGVIMGLGPASYEFALDYLRSNFTTNNAEPDHV